MTKFQLIKRKYHQHNTLSIFWNIEISIILNKKFAIFLNFGSMELLYLCIEEKTNRINKILLRANRMTEYIFPAKAKAGCN
jgi:hypothetical protein